MTITFNRKSIATAAAAFALAFGSTALRAEPATVGLTVTCAPTGPGVAACVGIGLLLNEFVNLANGKEAFGPNGEIRKIVEAPISIISGNIAAMEREGNGVAKAVRGSLGISFKDIEQNGLSGGPNSFFRKPFG